MKFKQENLPSNKKFGYFFSVIFLLSSAYFFYQDALTTAAALLVLSFIFTLLSRFKDPLLLPLNKLWMRFGVLLGTIISPIILAILFFVMFTPIAIGMRLFQRDELRLKSSNFDSFWKFRDQDIHNKNPFTQQF
jgi:dolichyl-phosphate-mannose--protein O-mannosyl transferase